MTCDELVPQSRPANAAPLLRVMNGCRGRSPGSWPFGDCTKRNHAQVIGACVPVLVYIRPWLFLLWVQICLLSDWSTRNCPKRLNTTLCTVFADCSNHWLPGWQRWICTLPITSYILKELVIKQLVKVRKVWSNSNAISAYKWLLLKHSSREVGGVLLLHWGTSTVFSTD